MEKGQTSSVKAIPEPDFAAICHSVRTALEPARVHAVSLHDENGELLWLTESSMGPDEHGAVHAALEAFSKPAGPTLLDFDLGDGRSALLVRAVNAARVLVGVTMIILETRVFKSSSGGAARLMNPGLQRALTEFAAMRPQTTSTRPAAAGAGMAPKVTEAPSTPSARRNRRTVPPEIDRLNSALRRIPIALHAQRLVPLSRGSELARFEVLLRSRATDSPNGAPLAMLKAAVDHGLGSMIDRRVITELIGWLVRNPAIWKDRKSMFSVNLTRTALLDEHFLKFVGLCLAKAALPKGTLGFEIDVEMAIEFGDKAADLAAFLHVLGSPLVLDDFGLRTECFDLLRLPGVRYVKLDSDITDRMRADKLCQAAITAVVQMARVLGMHTVAKRTETEPEIEWLTALGVDFVQSNALSAPVPIDRILTAAKP
jgi:EAL domain-containing protein (putative c-di-GMP-specific phosphodiesterase class I)